MLNSRNTTFDGGNSQILTFGSFGLSTVDASTGELTLKPGTGFNGALLHSDIANVVIQALQTDKRIKVLSKPSVLVNDNATGTLLSENEEPYASVNASSTVATTSFGGYSSAGTKITIKPQISEGDYLKLKYEITLSSFGEDRTDSLPPSRQKNSLTSEVTVPSGDTIVVGGLSQEKLSKTVDRIPGVGSVPILEYLFSSRSNETHRTTLFVFIRAVILRDDKFESLKALSSQAAVRAGLASDPPVSEPVDIQ